MNRLQKKCLIATIGLHLSLLLVLVFGAAFFTEQSKPDETKLLDVIPANLIDAAFSQGVRGAQPPPPTPIIKPPEPPPPTPPPQPRPVVTPPPPTPPEPTLVQKVKDLFTPEPKKLIPDELKPVEPTDKPTKPEPKKIKVSLDPIVRKTTKVPDTSAADTARAEKRERDQQIKAFQTLMRNIKDNTSTATEINMPGNSSVAYASYGAAVVSVYHQAWIAPDHMNGSEAVVRFTVTISREGNVISSRVVKSSGDAAVDKAVQRMLDRVSFIGEFPDDSKDKQRTYNIDFNATRTSML